MQAQKYKIDVYRSALDFAHGFHATIEEIYIPNRRIYVNFADRTATVFKNDAKRFRTGKEVETIEINDQVVRDLERFVEQKGKIDKIVRKLLPPKTQRQVAHSRKPEEGL
jgi:hypothetical protein